MNVEIRGKGHAGPPAAIVFDFDGVIVDSEVAELATWHAAYSAVGLVFPEDRWMDLVGRASVQGGGFFDAYAELEAATGRQRDALREERHRQVQSIVEVGPTLPGVEALVKAARADGIPVGIASSAVHRWVDHHLDRRGLLPLFDCVVTAEDVGGVGKPAPAVYLEALRRLGTDPRRSVAIEDSPNGIAAAKAAGMLAVAVPNAITRRLALTGADVTVESLAGISVATIRGWFG